MYMRRFFVSIAALALLLAAASTSFPHELIVKPTKMEAPAGETLPVELHSTHKFIVPEEVEDVSYITAGMIEDGKLVKSELKGNAPDLRIDFSVKTTGRGVSIVVADKVGSIWSVTNEGGKDGGRKKLEGEGLKVISSTRYDKYAKAIVNASAADRGYGTIVGQDLEIVPIDNPAEAQAGKYFRVRILHLGQPAAVPVWATYDGFCTEYESTYAYYTESAADGTAYVKITSPGLWLIRASKENDPGAEGEFDSRSLRSTLTFAVK